MMTSSPPAPPGTNDQLSPIRSSRPLLGQAAAGKVRDVVVADIWRLGRAPVANLRNVDALGQAGVTVHVASGILTGPILDDCGRGSTYAFGIADARRIDGDDEPDRDDPSFD